MSLTRAKFLEASLRSKSIDIPSLGDSVTAREITSNQAVEFSRRQSNNPENAVYYLVVAGIVDDAGNPIFTDADIDAIKGLGAGVVNTLIEGVMELSSMKSSGDEKKVS